MKKTSRLEPNLPDALIIVERGEGKERQEAVRMGFRLDTSESLLRQQEEVLALAHQLHRVYQNETDHYVHIRVSFHMDYVNI
jgi:hypothetical protein